MEYLDEQEVITAFYSLISVQSEIYDLTLKKMVELEKKGLVNSLEYDECMKKLNVFRIKEKRIYDKLNNSEYYYELFEVVQNIIGEFCMIEDDTLNHSEYSQLFEEVSNVVNKTCDDKNDLNEADYYNILTSVKGIIEKGSFYKIDEEKKAAISERLEYHFSELFNEEYALAEFTENIYDYVDIDEEYEGEIAIVPEFEIIDFYTPLQVEFIGNLMENDALNDEYINYKFYNSFINPRLEEELFLTRYNPNNSFQAEDELVRQLYDMDLEEYKNNVNFDRERFAEEAFSKFVETASDLDVTPEQLDLPFRKVIFGTSKLETRKMIEFMRKHFNSDEHYNISLNSVEYFERLGNSLLDTIFYRDDYDESMLNLLNSDNVDLDFSEVKFDDETYDNLFNLINISKEIYFIFSDLYYLDLNFKKGSKEYLDKVNFLEELLKEEKKYAMELDFSNLEKGAVKELVQNYLEFILASDERDNIVNNDEINNEFISKRINKNLWNDFALDLSIFKDSNIPNTIAQNYQLECLGEYEKLILDDERNDYLAFKYLQIISNPNLTEEFIFEKGCIEDSIILDDEITSRILEIDLDEYLYDKNELITNHVYEIMVLLAKVPKDYELKGFDKALFEYQTLALEIAFKYVNPDVLEEFKNSFESLSMIENSILNKKIKTIFNKKDKKVELIKKRH